jgi:hypothetical protein
MRRVGSTLLVCGLFLAVFSVRTGKAQELYGQIKGAVTDTSGAVIPEAQVAVTNTQTGVVRNVASTSGGTFELLQLPVGTYTAAVGKTGFKSFSVTGIVIELNRTYVLQATLQPGQVTQSVEVKANPAQVETSTTQLDTVIDAKTIVDLPLDGRNWTQLQQLAPGVMSSSDRFGTYSTNGGQTQQNSYLINGADSINLLTNTPGIVPSPDAIQEFNLITSTINAEYSRNGGAILNAVIKSGTNQFHGSAFEFYRDTFLNAHNYLQYSPPVFHQNQYGGTVGGPVWKDHTFFFFSYQGTRASQPQTGYGLTPVYSQAERGGDFSDGSGTCPFGSSVSPESLEDSAGVTQPAGTPWCTLFPTGVIPTSDFNSIAAKFTSSYVPLPNAANNDYSFSPVTTVKQDQEILRIDHTFGASDSLWGSLYIENYPTADALAFTPYGATLPGFGDVSQDHNKNFTVDWSHTFNATTLNELRLSYQRINQTYDSPQQVTLPSSAGFNITPQDPTAAGLPFVSVFGLFSIGFSEYGPQLIVNQDYELADNLSKSIGNHVLKFGFDGKRYNMNYQYDEFNNGAYFYDGTGTFSTGNPGADFLLGVPDTYYQDTPGLLASRSYEYYGYGQDTWKIRPDLTLNYGLGYQVDTPLNNFAYQSLGSNCFNLNQQSTIFPTAPVGLLYPGDSGCSQSGYYTRYGHFGPRFGFAYSPGAEAEKKWSIRGGFGIYYNRNVGELANPFLNVAPFSLFQEGVAQIGGSPSFTDPWSGWTVSSGTVSPVTYANPYPFHAPAQGSNVDFSAYEPIGLTVTDRNFTSASTMNFNLNVQRELPGAMVLQAGYVGALGRHLNLVVNKNPISLAGAAECIADYYCSTYYHFYQDYYYSSHFQLYPGNILSAISDEESSGRSSYHSLQASLNKHLTRGMSFLVSYTWSHSIDNGSGYEDSIGEYGAGLSTNPYNPSADIADSVFDARHRLIASYDYEIPGITRYVNNAFTRVALSGWHFAGITTLQTGFPMAIIDSSDPSFTTCGCDTANLVGKFRKLDPRSSATHLYFDTSAFQEAPIGSFGTLRRNPFHGPGVNNTDALLAKRVSFGETRLVELRLEGYNLFNHTQFAAPVTDIHSPLFGEVQTAGIGRVIQLGGKFYF